MSIIQNIEVSVFEGLIYNRHAFETFDVLSNNRDGCFSGVQHKGFDFTIFRGCGNRPLSGVFLYCECTIGDGLLSVIRSSGVSAIQGFLMY